MNRFDGFEALNQLLIWISILMYLGGATVALAYVRLSAWLWLVAAAFAGITAVGAGTQLAVVFLTRTQGADFRLLGIFFASASLLRVLLVLALVVGLGLSFADIGRRLGPGKVRGDVWT